MTKNEMDESRQAFNAWSQTTVKERLKLFKNLREQIVSHMDEIIGAITKDTEKAPLDALGGDVLTTLEGIRYFEKTAHKLLTPRKLPKPGFFFWGTQFFEEFSPYGAVLVLAPWNYPFQLAVLPTLTALICGNTVVLKCSELAPETARLIARLFSISGFPENVLRLVEGGPEKGAELVDMNPDKIFLTGSLAAGQSILKKAAEKIIPVHLELGGKDAMIVFADADISRAVAGACYGAFANSGQVCVGVKRLYVHKSIYKNFIESLKTEMTKLKSVDGFTGELGPLVKSKKFQAPTLDETTGQDIANSDVEVFAPTVAAFPFDADDEVVELVNQSPFGLSASLWTRDFKKARRVAHNLVVGSCTINDVIRQVANPYAPFGGEKLSGLGRYHGEDGYRAFSRQKTIMINKSRKNKEINWFPFKKETFDILKKIIRFRHGKIFYGK